MDWIANSGLVEYADAVQAMEARVGRIAAEASGEAVWLLEHPPIYTAGKSAKPADLLPDPRFPVHATARGGQYTYHGPGQRVAYVMLDLRKRGRDLRKFVGILQSWVILSLSEFGVQCRTSSRGIGVWASCRKSGCRNELNEERKIAAVGIRLRQWISFHGVSINVMPNLEHYSGIVPCGIRDFGVTSLAELGVGASMQDVDEALIRNFEAALEAGGQGISRGSRPAPNAWMRSASG